MMRSVLRATGIACVAAIGLLAMLYLLPVSSESITPIPVELRGRFVRDADDTVWYIDPVHRDRTPVRTVPDVAVLLRARGLGIDEQQFTVVRDPSTALAVRLAGRILLRVEARGEAYYVDPDDRALHELGRPHDALKFFEAQANAIPTIALSAIPVAE